jgi:hypothetical protein
MPISPARSAADTSRIIKDYVEATTDAARRTRIVAIVLVVASVLILIAFYNSLDWSWPIARVRSAYDPADTSADKALDVAHHPLLLLDKDKDGKSPANHFREQLQEANVRAYVENVRFVRVPFVGVAFDVNDLGTIGGIGLILILFVMRYSLSREIKNLNYSFREAARLNRFDEFYHALAMRQVLTVPHMAGEERNRLLAVSPQFVHVLPAAIFSVGVAYDYYSVFKLGYFKPQYVSFTLVTETLWLVFILLLAAKCWGRQRHIDNIWEENWKKLNQEPPPVFIQLDSDLAQEYKNDDDVNRALRNLRMKSPKH